MKAHIETKLLSVNAAWKGQRFKTDAYKAYERKLLLLLPKMKVPDPPFILYLDFGMSNPRADFDNPVKLIVAIAQKKYGFNDCDIISAHITKQIVAKGQEYFTFRLESAHGDEF